MGTFKHIKKIHIRLQTYAHLYEDKPTEHIKTYFSVYIESRESKQIPGQNTFKLGLHPHIFCNSLYDWFIIQSE